MRIEQLSLDEWRDELPSSGFEVFHLPEALAVLDEYGDGQLRLFAGIDGESVVGLWPTFVRNLGAGRAIFSPSPQSGIQRLGPILAGQDPSRRTRERSNHRFVERVVEEVGMNTPLSLAWMNTSVAYEDPRPLRWAGMELEPRFTYVVDLTRDIDTIRAEFSRSLRREIDAAAAAGVTIERGGDDGFERIYHDTVDRYEEQGHGYAKSEAFVLDFLDALDERARAYVARSPEGEYLGGVTVLFSNDLAYFWQGGTRANYEGSSINGLLHWRIIEDLLSDPPVDSLTGYDLVGANVERLAQYKAKFGADMVPYYHVETGGLAMDAVKEGYRRVSSRIP